MTDRKPERMRPVDVARQLALLDLFLAKEAAKTIRDLLELNAELLEMLVDLRDILMLSHNYPAMSERVNTLIKKARDQK